MTVYTTWQDHGQGADMGVVGTAHQALLPLELDPSQIKLFLNDTAYTPNGGSSGGSRSQVVIGNAIKDGCENLLAAMRREDGNYRTYEEMVAEGLALRYVGKWTASTATNCDENAQGKPFAAYMYSVFIAEGDIDARAARRRWRALPRSPTSGRSTTGSW